MENNTLLFAVSHALMAVGIQNHGATAASVVDALELSMSATLAYSQPTSTPCLQHAQTKWSCAQEGES